jgi:hypothetical protein
MLLTVLRLNYELKCHQKELENIILSRQKAFTTAKYNKTEKLGLTIANKTDNQRNERLKTHRETQQLVRVNVKNFERDIYVFAETIFQFDSKRCYPNQPITMKFKASSIRTS